MSKATFDPKNYNLSQNEPFSEIVEKHLSRRKLLKTGSGMAALSMLSGFALQGCGGDDDQPSTASPISGVESPNTRLGFESIGGTKLDAVSVPEGYSAQVLAPWGSPLNDLANDFQDDGSNTADDQENAVGMHHDGMEFFAFDGSNTEGLLCINHEFIDQNALHTIDFDNSVDTRLSAEEIRKEINAHGVSVVRVKRENGVWNIVKNDEYNRRLTGASIIDIAGPLVNQEALITPFSPDGSLTRGTLNNCANGRTPWGTYLTCEENWPGYFVNRGELSADQERIGLSATTTRYRWDDVSGDASEIDGEFSRFNITATEGGSANNDYRNEANGYGYIVEIDLFTPTSRAVKRTALGRFRHEGCTVGKLEVGKPVVFYSGHDAHFEYIYKFVSTALWNPVDTQRSDSLAVGAKYMDEGTLYVARFDADGTGVWLPLTLDSRQVDGALLSDNFQSLADIILNTAGAADLVGATPMDRPEWIAVDPENGAVYATLTNNTRRTESTGGTNPANPRLNNKFGHIIRWNEDESGLSFSWDIFLFGSPADGDSATNLSGLTDLNQLASPDGLKFDSRGILWIQTDNEAEEVAEETNDQMLAVVPAELVNSDAEPLTVGRNNQSILRRFFVGPNGSEVTGLTFTPDNKNFFVNIQHPSMWPNDIVDATQVSNNGFTIRPRSSTVVITKDDEGEIGI